MMEEVLDEPIDFFFQRSVSGFYQGALEEFLKETTKKSLKKSMTRETELAE